MGIFSSKEQQQKSSVECAKEAKEEDQKKKPTTRVLISRVDEQRRLIERQHELHLRRQLKQHLELRAVRIALLDGKGQYIQHTIIRRPDRIGIHRDIHLINELRAACNLPNILSFSTKAIWSEDVQPWSMEYREAHQYFYKKNNNNFKIRSIRKATNPFLELHYLIAKQKLQRYGENVREVMLFHGTKVESLEGILTYNFDRTKVIHHKFGHGISFARDAFYATHYHQDNKTNFSKVMIIAKVFFGQLHFNSSDTTIVPPIPSYTSCNSNMSVFVKFDDASYYPEYVIHYTGFHEYRTRYDTYSDSESD